MSVIKEFKEFALRGNVIDLAVGVIIGGAFGKIVASVVNDILMPPIGVLLGGVDFKDLKLEIKEAAPAIMEGDKVIKEAVAAVTLNYGSFIQTVVDFTIVAFCIFLLVKGMNKLKKKEPAPAPEPEPEPTNEEKLLTEIRDLLKK
ncbi:MAG: large-conductance mechanosensitive channel protein MscL [Flavobacteriales bacterium]|nr:large-conductance mechanosensitive channel protein MscL [Flavobacteriales bacterium]